MEKIIESIERHGSQYLIHWLSDLKEGHEKVPTNFNWLFLAEKFSAKAFNESHFDTDFAKSAILIYEKIYQDGNSGALLSAMYLRLRMLEVVPLSELDSFFNPEFIVNIIREHLTLTVIEAESKASNWRMLDVKDIKLLREFKNWITILMRLEKITNQEYREFVEWKKIVHLLP